MPRAPNRGRGGVPGQHRASRKCSRRSGILSGVGVTLSFPRQDGCPVALVAGPARRQLLCPVGHVADLILLAAVSVNFAGIFPFGPTHQPTEADFDRVYAVNVKAPFFLVAELAPAMAKRRHAPTINATTIAPPLPCLPLAFRL